MARFVVFNGLTLVHPGGLSKVDVSAMAQTGVGITGIIGIIGESDGGTGTPRTLITMDDPSGARAVFRSGPLADAIRLAFEPSADPRIPGGAFRVVSYKTNLSTRSFVELDDAAGNAMMRLESKEYGESANAITFSLTEDPINTAQYMTQVTQGDVKEITTNIGGNSLMTLSLKGPDAPIVVATGEATGIGSVNQIDDTSVDSAVIFPNMFVEILTSTTGSIVGEIRRITTVTDGANLIVSDGAAAAGFTAAVPNDTTYRVLGARVIEGAFDVAPTADTANISPDISGGVLFRDDAGTNYLVNKLLRITSGEGEGQIRVIDAQTHAAADNVVVTLAEDFDTIPALGDSFAIVDCTAATATIAGATGAAATIACTPTLHTQTALIAGMGHALSVTLTGKTVTQVVAEINAQVALSTQPAIGGFYEAVVGPGRSGALSATLFDWGPGGNAAVDIRTDDDVDITTANFSDNLNTIVNAVNANSTLISASRETGASEGSGPPIFFTTASPAILTGAARGTSTNTDWQNAFDELLKTRINIVVPLISADLTVGTATVSSVHAQLTSHVNTASGIGRNERNAYASYLPPAVDGLNEVLAMAQDLGNRNVSLIYQSPTVLDINSNLVSQDPWALAMIAAGMQAGATVGEPLTYKYAKINSVNNNGSTLDPRDRTTSNQLLLGGVMFTEFIRGKGHRWVRGLTSYLIDDNLAYTDVSVNEVLNFISYELRTGIEDRFTGTKALPATVASIKSYIEGFLETYRQSDIIVDSFDVTSGSAVKAYNNITVTVSGDIATIKVSIFPVTGINYELLELFAQLPVISA
jgi:hypothetical protein